MQCVTAATLKTATFMLWALLSLPAAAEQFEWAPDWRQAWQDAQQASRPLFVVAKDGLGSPAEVSPALETLEKSETFRRAADGVTATTAATEIELREAFQFDTRAKAAALIILPDGKVLTIYDKLPVPEAVAKDIIAARATLGIQSAETAAEAGDDAAAIAAFRKALALAPPYRLARACHRGLSYAEKRGKVKILEAEASLAGREYAAAKRILEQVVAQYSGTDAERIARDRLREILTDPLVVKAIKTQEAEAAARKLLEEAQRAWAEGRGDAAVELCEKVLRDFKETPAAAKAAEQIKEMRTGTAQTNEKERQEMEAECRLWMSYADNLARMGKPQKAAEYYRQIVEKYPRSGYAETARKKLKEME